MTPPPAGTERPGPAEAPFTLKGFQARLKEIQARLKEFQVFLKEVQISFLVRIETFQGVIRDSGRKGPRRASLSLSKHHLRTGHRSPVEPRRRRGPPIRALPISIASMGTMLTPILIFRKQLFDERRRQTIRPGSGDAKPTLMPGAQRRA